MKKVIVSILAMVSVNAFAAEVKNLKLEYETVRISAENVEGIKVVLSRDIVRDDCNQRILYAEETFIDGNVEGEKPINWHSSYIVSAGMMVTEMYCPLENSVKETVKSDPIVFESYSNANLDKEVLVDLVVPKGYKVSVEEY